MQKQNFMNQGQDEEVGQTKRLNCQLEEKKIPKDFYDQYGFERRKDIQLGYLPVFIPFD